MLGSNNKTPDRGRHAVVAVIIEQSQFLVIRRSEIVRAPGLLCFPGGGIEENEDFESAIRRELSEELQLQVVVSQHIWTSVTRWGTQLGNRVVLAPERFRSAVSPGIGIAR